TKRGFLPLLFDCISKEIEDIQQKETSYTSDLSQGLVLKTMLDILSSFLDISTVRQKAKRENFMENLLNAFLSLRGVTVQRTKLIEDSCKTLSNLLDKLKGDNVEDQKLFIVACVKALRKH